MKTRTLWQRKHDLSQAIERAIQLVAADVGFRQDATGHGKTLVTYKSLLAEKIRDELLRDYQVTTKARGRKVVRHES